MTAKSEQKCFFVKVTLKSSQLSGSIRFFCSYYYLSLLSYFCTLSNCNVNPLCICIWLICKNRFRFTSIRTCTATLPKSALRLYLLFGLSEQPMLIVWPHISLYVIFRKHERKVKKRFNQFWYEKLRGSTLRILLFLFGGQRPLNLHIFLKNLYLQSELH